MHAKSPCKRAQHCWPATPNIVGANNVVTCCVRLHGTTKMLALVAYMHSLKPVKLLAQQVPTFLLFSDRRSVAQQCCMEPQQCWPRENVGTRAL